MKTITRKLILALAWLALPLLAQAQFTFTTNSGAITITGCTGSGGAVVIPAATNGYPVIGIGNSAFEGNLNMTSVTIPDSVTNIGFEAFNSCDGLTNVTIPNSVASIGNEAFINCYGLMSVTIGDGVTSIGSSAFHNCHTLTSVTIPNSVVAIGNGAFLFCTSLRSVTIPNSVTSIGQGAFGACYSLTSIIIPASLINMGPNAFSSCTSLTAAYFGGNQPPDLGDAFLGDPAIVYYLAGTTGWSPTFGGVPAVLWNPQAIKPGFTGGQFGFNLTGIPYAGIVIEATTNLSNPVWLPVATNTFSASGTSTFFDPSNYPSRFYRFRSP
jgi:hypothetical protein